MSASRTEGSRLSSRYASLMRVYERMTLDLRPLGGSSVILTPFCRMATGK
jgi:hypothetical protein